MKNQSERIADQLKRAFDGEAWHGPSLKEAVSGITAKDSVARPIRDAHSIWEIVAHIAGWEDVIARRLKGESVSEPVEGDFPSPLADPSEADWKALLEKAYSVHDQLVGQMAALTEENLRRRVDGKSYPAWIMAHGAVGHALYHTGQIVLIKKALNEGQRPGDRSMA